MPDEKASTVMAFTASYGERRFLRETVPSMRGTSGMWFDWAVFLGDPSVEAQADAFELLNDPQRRGIQRLAIWPENRGQHHATKEAIQLAKEGGYKWLLRVDDDITPKTLKWLKKMVEQVQEVKRRAGDNVHRIVAAPKIVGLRNPLRAIGPMSLGQGFDVEAMPILGGGCRLHPMEIMEDYEPPLYAPLGRGDPDALAKHVHIKDGLLVRLGGVRVVHRTDEIESHDSEAQAHKRRMGYYWPWLGGDQ